MIHTLAQARIWRSINAQMMFNELGLNNSDFIQAHKAKLLRRPKFESPLVLGQKI